jgi:hypothetical protein
VGTHLPTLWKVGCGMKPEQYELALIVAAVLILAAVGVLVSFIVWGAILWVT